MLATSLWFHPSNTLSLWTVWLKLTTVPVFCEEESKLQGQQLHGLDLESGSVHLLHKEMVREKRRCPVSTHTNRRTPTITLYRRTRMHLRHTLVATTWNACTLVEAAGGNRRI